MAYDDEMEIGEARQPLIDTFKRIEVYKSLLKLAINAAQREKQAASKDLLKINSTGFRNIHNKCDQCGKNLLPPDSLDTYIKKI